MGRVGLFLAAVALGCLPPAGQGLAKPSPAAPAADQAARPDPPASTKDAYYLAEVMFRNREGVIFLARDLLTAAQKTSLPMPTVGFAHDGQPIAPPQAVRNPDASWPTPRQSAYWISRDKKYAPALGTAVAGNYDRAVVFALPRNEGEHTTTFAYRALYRLERLSPEQARQFRPLANDAAFCAKRTQELSLELLLADRAKVLADPHALADATILLRDPGLLEAVRLELKKFTQPHPPTRLEQDLLDAVAMVGGPEDFTLLKAMLASTPATGSYMIYPVAYMARRLGLAAPAARELLLDLLNCKLAPAGVSADVQRLLAIDPATPAPMVCDQMAAALARQFNFDPAAVGLSLAEARLLAAGAAGGAAGDRLKLSRQEKIDLEEAVRTRSGDWIMASAASRAEGLKKLRDWIDLQSKRPPDKASPPRPSTPPRQTPAVPGL